MAGVRERGGMRVLVLGGTSFLGRRVVERLHERGDQVLVVHRGRNKPADWVPVAHLYTDRRDLANRSTEVTDFDPQAIVDTCAMTAADVDSVVPVLPYVPTVVLSSQDVYQAHAALLAGRCDAAVPLTEDSELRRDRYPYRSQNLARVPDDYSKRDVEDRWLPRGAVVLRLPLVYGPWDWQRREDIVLCRLRAGRLRIPVGVGNLLWTRSHVDDLATGVLAALDNRAADGLAINLGEPQTVTLRGWMRQILDAAESKAELVRVPDSVLPPDLAITAAPAQHLLVCVARAQQLLGWTPADPTARVTQSVHWHLAHPPTGLTWTDEDTTHDNKALDNATEE
ncbi:MAG: NAD-dependent epimerase/dehydratase family protein [Pseudonocardiales bacterium]|nr:NAD-dependent epimerase/dehydratase family protein [Pseudonocardiales bacterium]